MDLSKDNQIKRQLLKLIINGNFPPESKLPPIRTLAKDFGVSISTIQKVIKTLKSDGYVESLPGSGVVITTNPQQKKSSNKIAILYPVPTVNYLEGDLYPKPIIDALKKKILKFGYELVPCPLAKIKPWDLLEHIIDLDPAGIIFFEVNSDMVILELSELGLPTISIDVDLTRYGIPSVIPDKMYSMFELTNHLIDKGHQYIKFIHCPHYHKIGGKLFYEQIDENMLHGYRMAMLNSKLTVSVDNFYSKSPSFDLTNKVSKIFHKKNSPTAIICESDFTTRIIIKIITDAGLKIPDDISLVGIGKSDEEFSPGEKITSIKLDLKKMGDIAGKFLLDTLNDSEISVQRSIVPTKIIYNQSIKKI
ncbi:MAG: hypothetical protein COA79_11940 [Planctomycetota bacterium]|nr:MAG: hypothetical protein COA79_11940 [Planctomycetota bacterium]